MQVKTKGKNGDKMNIVLIELHKDEMKEKLYSNLQKKIKYIIRKYTINRTEKKLYRKYSTSKDITDYVTALF